MLRLARDTSALPRDRPNINGDNDELEIEKLMAAEEAPWTQETASYSSRLLVSFILVQPYPMRAFPVHTWFNRSAVQQLNRSVPRTVLQRALPAKSLQFNSSLYHEGRWDFLTARFNLMDCV